MSPAVHFLAAAYRSGKTFAHFRDLQLKVPFSEKATLKRLLSAVNAIGL
jgi:hypothetical protein